MKSSNIVVVLFVAVCVLAPGLGNAEPPPTYLSTWGSSGSGNGQFLEPFGIDIGSNGRVYVIDTQNERIQVFNQDGSFLFAWGTFGTGDGQFISPYDLALDSADNVYVGDSGNNRIQKFDENGNYLDEWGSYGTADGQFDYPMGIAVDEFDDVYVTELSANRIQKFSSSGVFQLKWGSNGSNIGEFDTPVGIAAGPGSTVYVVDAGNDRIQVFDELGLYLNEWGSNGTGDGQFDYPYHVAADTNGDIYVTDTFNNRVQKFDQTGAFLAKWGSPGSGPGQFSYPSGIAVDDSVNVYVAEQAQHRVQRFAYKPEIDLTLLFDMGEIPVGQSLSVVLDITNTGTGWLNISDMTIDNPAFTLGKTAVDIPPLSANWVTVIFSPLAPGTFEATLTILCNDWETDTVEVFVEGVGQPADHIIEDLSTPPELRTSCAEAIVSVTVQNNGGADPAPFRLGLYASPDSIITTSDVLLDTTRINGLDTLEDTTVTFSTTLPPNMPRGHVYLGAFADDLDAIEEEQEDNNETFNPFEYHLPLVNAARDIPGDQGGLIYGSWNGSPLDAVSEGGLITEYSLWRAINAEMAQLMIAREEAIPLPSLAEFKKTEKTLIRTETAAGQTIFWELIDSQTAYYIETYAKTLPTLFDSTAVSWEYHYFQTIAHTADPLTFYVSAPDSGYSVDNLAPAQPLNAAAEQKMSPEGCVLFWDPNTEADLSHYTIYRGDTGDFVPDESNMLSTTPDTTVTDSEWRWDDTYYYKIAAVDVHGNASLFAVVAPDDVTGTQTALPPRASYLGNNHPNPFNPTTTIEFGLVNASEVALVVYDVKGRHIKTLVKEQLPADHHRVDWNGMDSRGEPVASGVYFYRLTTGDFKSTKKMLLLK